MRARVLAVLGGLLLPALSGPARAQAPNPGTAGPSVRLHEGAGALMPMPAPARPTTLPNLAETAGWPSPVADTARHSFTLFDLLELEKAPGYEAARWDILGWYGTDYNRFWYKSEGRANGVRRTGDADLQLLYGRLISPFFDLQAGLRHERFWGPGSSRGRSSVVLGLQGIAPYGSEVETAVFVSQDGDVSARVTVAQNFLLTQRLILLPRFEINAAIQRAARYGVGAGVNDIELGVRLRYEIRREFAPYVGVSWWRSLGETARLREAEGQNRSLLQVVAGIRMWF